MQMPKLSDASVDSRARWKLKAGPSPVREKGKPQTPKSDASQRHRKLHNTTPKPGLPLPALEKTCRKSNMLKFPPSSPSQTLRDRCFDQLAVH